MKQFNIKVISIRCQFSIHSPLRETQSYLCLQIEFIPYASNEEKKAAARSQLPFDLQKWTICLFSTRAQVSLRNIRRKLATP